MGNVWLQLLDGGLLRADQVTEITLNQTPEIAGKRARWLLDVMTAVPVGGGDRDDWHTGPLHRTLAQVNAPPRDAPTRLARLLAELDTPGTAGIVRAETPRSAYTDAPGEVRFAFTPFADDDAGQSAR